MAEAGAAGYSVTGDDTQYDAEAEEGLYLDLSDEDSEYDPNLFSKGRVQDETGIKTGNLPQGTVDRKMIEYKHYLPEKLKQDYYYEILILNAETDEDEAMSLKEGIENNVMFCGAMKPNTILLKDFIPIKMDGDPLNEAFKRTLYVVLYVTGEFCKQSWQLFQSHACLKRALTSKEEQWSIIPVHTSPKHKRNYELPLMLDGLRPLNYFSKTFYQDVKNLLEHKSNVILERKATLAIKREQYIVANSEKLRFLSTATKNVMVPNNQPESPVKVSVPNKELQNRTSVKVKKQYQAEDSNHRSSQQKTKNTSPLQKQQQQEMNQHVLVSTESSGKKSYLRPKSYETDYSLGVATDSPSSAETYGKTSEKDVSPEDSNQMGRRSDAGCNKSCYSSSVKTSTVEYSSLAEPPDDKAVPENPNLNAFPTAESDVSHTGSRINLPTGQRNTYSRREDSDNFTEDGSHPNIQASPNNPVREAPRDGRARLRRSENTSTFSGSEIHIHIHHANNVAIGESTINVLSAFDGNEDGDNPEASEESEDSENANSYAM